jgi:hypothetical protein
MKKNHMINPRCPHAFAYLKPREWVDTPEDRAEVKKIMAKKPTPPVNENPDNQNQPSNT